MKTSNAVTWNSSSKQYERNLGWIIGDDGKRRQPKFRLGRDEAEAVRRVKLLELMWKLLGTSGWNKCTLAMADQVRQGKTVLECPAMESREDFDIDLYRARLDMYGSVLEPHGLTVVPTPEDGEALAEIEQADAVDMEWQVQQIRKRYEMPAKPQHTTTVHEAIDKHTQWEEERLCVAGQRKAWSGVLADQCERLKRCVPAGMLLEQFGLDAIEAAADYWRKRPDSQQSGQPIALSTVGAHLKVLRRFLLRVERHYNWYRLPSGWPEVCKVNLKQLKTDAEKQHRPVKTFTLEQLAILWKYSSEPERLTFLLAMNCAFGAAECSTLRLDEVQAGYIKRNRVKTEVYGEWKLWPETLAQFGKWMEVRRTIKPAAGHEHTALLTTSGLPLVRLSEAGNTTNRIAHGWNTKLLPRIRKDFPDFPRLSFNKLRKTSANLIRKLAGPVAASQQLAHAHDTDDELLNDYSHRHFDELFAAQDKLHQLMQEHVFNASRVEAHKRSTHSVSTIERIRQLWQQEMKPDDIAAATGTSRATVYRYRPA